MTTAEAFLEDILANPADDWLRLIYADYLEDNGQEERSEFIRVQIELFNWPCECDDVERVYHPECKCKEKGELQRRERELLKNKMVDTSTPKHRRRTQLECLMATEALGRYALVSRYTWHRGFMQSVVCTCEAWLKQGSALVRQHPLERVELSDLDIGESSVGDGWFILPASSGFMAVVFPDQPRSLWNDRQQTREGMVDFVSRGCLFWARRQP